MKTQAIKLITEPLTAEAFAPFGNVIEADLNSGQHFSINAGAVERFNDLAQVNVCAQSGLPLISLAICNHATTLPFHIAFLERHPLGSQAFIPMCDTPMIIAVAPATDKVNPADIRAFMTNGQQGINYHPSIWHMPMAPLKNNIKMIIIDRGGEGNNYEEFHFPNYQINIDID